MRAAPALPANCRRQGKRARNQPAEGTWVDGTLPRRSQEHFLAWSTEVRSGHRDACVLAPRSRRVLATVLVLALANSFLEATQSKTMSAYRVRSISEIGPKE